MDQKKEFLNEVYAQVRFKWDWSDIRDELSAHIEERAEGYLAQGLSEEEAEAKAVECMGDPTALGKALDKEHRPWLGRLWIGTNIAAVILLILFLPNLWMTVLSLFESTAWERDKERLQDKIVYAIEIDKKITLDHETFFFDELFYTEDGELWFHVTAANKTLIRGTNIFWGHDVSFVYDDQGKRDWHSRGGSWGGDQVKSRFMTEYSMHIDGFTANTEFIEFRYDKYGRQFSFKVMVEGGEIIE